MADVITIGPVSAAPGAKAAGYLTVAWLNDASPVQVPVMIVNGAQDGTRLWIQGGSHGNEYAGPMAIQDLYREVEPKAVRGALILLPVINVTAFRAGTRGAPQDGLDMNRIWPGNPLARARHIYAHSEIVVHQLVTHLERWADAVVDCHSGGWPHRMSPYAQYFIAEDPVVSERSRAMALGAGLPLLWATSAQDYSEKAGGSIGTYLDRLGRPSITLEVGGEGRVPESDRVQMREALSGICRALGILPGAAPRHRPRFEVQKVHWLRAARGGALYPLVEPLDPVEQGQPVARITDLLGEELETITAPAAGVVVGHRTLQMVNSGEYVCNVGEVVRVGGTP